MTSKSADLEIGSTRLLTRRERFSHVLSLVILLFSAVLARADGQTDARELVRDMLRNEVTYSNDPNYAMYLSSESSRRTGGHLWEEKVVELQVIRPLDGK